MLNNNNNNIIVWERELLIYVWDPLHYIDHMCVWVWTARIHWMGDEIV